MNRKEYQQRLKAIVADSEYTVASVRLIEQLILDLIGEDEAKYYLKDIDGNPMLKKIWDRQCHRNELRQELRDIVQGKAIDSK